MVVRVESDFLSPSTDQHSTRHTTTTTTTRGSTMTDTHHATDAMNLIIRGKAGHGDEQANETDEQDNEQEQAVPSFDGGARTTAPRTLDMNALLRGKVDRWHRGE